MNYIKFLMTGIIFGIILAKAEIISWFRIYEMFRFESFYMYGIIGSAIAIGILIIQIIKKTELKSTLGQAITIQPKNRSKFRYIIGGIIFGLGWGLVGACPGPMFVLLGYGYLTILVVLLGAILGTFVYGLLKTKLPH